MNTDKFAFSIFTPMGTSTEINNLRQILAKNPKSLLFARLADALRAASHVQGYEQQLDEALSIVSKGLSANPNFLLGKLVRGQILFEKGDIAGAKSDLEIVAERDPFCLTAKKLLSEMESGNSESISVFDALDNIAKEEDEKEERKTQSMLILAVDNIIETVGGKAKPTVMDTVMDNEAPNIDSLISEQLSDRVEDMPDLTGDIDSLLASAADSNPLPELDNSQLEEEPKPEVNIDSLISEQLSGRVEEMPDLTSDMDALLASAKAEAEPEPEPLFTANSQLEEESKPEVNIDSIINEQLSGRVEEMPDLTSDMDALLASAKAEPEPEPLFAANSQLEEKSEQEVNIDSIINEQLSDRVKDIPDASGEIEEILTQNPTETLAEIYMNQGLPQKAVEVYKALLYRDPDNVELKAKLALAEIEAV